MKFILNVYYHGEVLHVNFFGALSSMAELLPFYCLNFNDFFRPQP